MIYDYYEVNTIIFTCKILLLNEEERKGTFFMYDVLIQSLSFQLKKCFLSYNTISYVTSNLPTFQNEKHMHK